MFAGSRAGKILSDLHSLRAPGRLDRHEALKPWIAGRRCVEQLGELPEFLGIRTKKHLVEQHRAVGWLESDVSNWIAGTARAHQCESFRLITFVRGLTQG